MFVLRVAQELDYYLHLCPREHFGILLVAHVLHGLPHAARVVHLATEEAQSRVVAMVGVVHLCQLPERITLNLELFHVCLLFSVPPDGSFQGCKQHSFVLINQQSSQPTLSYRVGVFVFVLLTMQRYAYKTPPPNISAGEEIVWKMFGRCLPPMEPKRKLSPRKRKLFGRI